MIPVFRSLLVYFRLPLSIRRRVTGHFINRLIRKPSSDHQVIWTSFFYFAIESDVRVAEFHDYYLVSVQNGKKGVRYQLRKNTSSDVFVFFQIMIRREYAPLFTFIKEKGIPVHRVVDAGANIGLFSLEASFQFPASHIQSIEPDPSNFDLMKANIGINNAGMAISAHQFALWTNHTDGLGLIRSDDWSVRVTESSLSSLQARGRTLNELLDDCGWQEIDLLKLDVEGTEGVLFSDPGFLSLLGRIKVIALEVHDHLCNRDMVYAVLRDNQFDLFESGEMTIAWNKIMIPEA